MQSFLIKVKSATGGERVQSNTSGVTAFVKYEALTLGQQVLEGAESQRVAGKM